MTSREQLSDLSKAVGNRLTSKELEPDADQLRALRVYRYATIKAYLASETPIPETDGGLPVLDNAALLTAARQAHAFVDGALREFAVAEADLTGPDALRILRSEDRWPLERAREVVARWCVNDKQSRSGEIDEYVVAAELAGWGARVKDGQARTPALEIGLVCAQHEMIRAFPDGAQEAEARLAAANMNWWERIQAAANFKLKADAAEAWGHVYEYCHRRVFVRGSLLRFEDRSLDDTTREELRQRSLPTTWMKTIIQAGLLDWRKRQAGDSAHTVPLEEHEGQAAKAVAAAAPGPDPGELVGELLLPAFAKMYTALGHPRTATTVGAPFSPSEAREQAWSPQRILTALFLERSLRPGAAVDAAILYARWRRVLPVAGARKGTVNVCPSDPREWREFAQIRRRESLSAALDIYCANYEAHPGQAIRKFAQAVLADETRRCSQWEERARPYLRYPGTDALAQLLEMDECSPDQLEQATREWLESRVRVERAINSLVLKRLSVALQGTNPEKPSDVIPAKDSRVIVFGLARLLRAELGPTEPLAGPPGSRSEPQGLFDGLVLRLLEQDPLNPAPSEAFKEAASGVAKARGDRSTWRGVLSEARSEAFNVARQLVVSRCGAVARNQWLHFAAELATLEATRREEDAGDE